MLLPMPSASDLALSLGSVSRDTSSVGFRSKFNSRCGLAELGNSGGLSLGAGTAGLSVEATAGRLRQGGSSGLAGIRNVKAIEELQGAITRLAQITVLDPAARKASDGSWQQSDDADSGSCGP